MGRRLSNISDTLNKKSEQTPRQLDQVGGAGVVKIKDGMQETPNEDLNPVSTSKEAVDPGAGSA